MAKKVEIGIKVDKSGATRGYKNFAKDVTSSNKKIRSELQKTKAASTGLGLSLKTLVGAAGGLFVFSKINNLVRESIRLAGEQASAVAKVEQTIRSTGGAAGITAEEMQKMASEFQNVTTFGDEVILRGQSMLLTFKQIGKDVFPAATEAMLNLSVAMGTDVKEASIQLGKALNDPTTGLTALRRVGITFSAQQENLIKGFQRQGDIASAQKMILQELESQFGGLAKAVALTGEGPLIQFQNIVGDTKELLGEALIPVLLDSVQGFKDFLIEGQKTGQLQKTFQGIANAARLMFAVVSDSFRGIQAVFKIAAAGFSALTVGLFVGIEKVIKAYAWLTSLSKDPAQQEIAKQARKTAQEFSDMADAGVVASKELFEEGLFSVEGGSKIDDAFRKIAEGSKKAKKEIEEVKGAAGLADVPTGGTAADPKAAAAAKKQKEREERERKQALEAAKRVQDELAILKEEGFQAELEKIRQWEEQKREVLLAAKQDTAELEKVANEKRLLAFQEMMEEETRITQENADKQKAIEDEKMNIRKEAVSNLVTNLSTMASEWKKFGALYKAAAIYETTIATYDSAQKQFKAGASFPYPANLVMPWVLSAAAVGAGLAKVVKIKQQKFQRGGVVEGGQFTGDRSPVLANRGEMFFNSQQQRNLLAIANGRGGGGQTNITFGNTIINANGGDADLIARKVNETRQEQIRAASHLLNEKDALLVT